MKHAKRIAVELSESYRPSHWLRYDEASLAFYRACGSSRHGVLEDARVAVRRLSNVKVPCPVCDRLLTQLVVMENGTSEKTLFPQQAGKDAQSGASADNPASEQGNG